MNKEYKYQKEIDAKLEQDGLSMPDLFPVDNLNAFRYVFRNNPSNSNLPVFVSSPKRSLKSKQIIGYALSCYTDSQKAEEKFYSILDTCKMFRKTGGDALAGVVLEKEDGAMSKVGDFTHFSLFEYVGCNLNKKIHILKDL